jgi:hypothetical protein
MTPSRDRRTYRATGTAWAAGGGLVGAGVFAVVGFTTGRGHVAALVGVAILLFIAWRMWHVGIQVGTDGVRVATFFLSRRVAWKEIDHFAVLPLGRYPFVGFVVLRSGRKYGTFGLSTSSWAGDKGRANIQRAVTALNDALADWRALSETGDAQRSRLPQWATSNSRTSSHCVAARRDARAGGCFCDPRNQCSCLRLATPRACNAAECGSDEALDHGADLFCNIVKAGAARRSLVMIGGASRKIPRPGPEHQPAVLLPLPVPVGASGLR